MLKLPADVPSSSAITSWAQDIETQIRELRGRTDAAHHTAKRAHALATANTPVLTGAIGSVIAGNFGYSSTENSITLYWDGTNSSSPFIIQMTDGASLTVPKGTQAITGLSASTNYRFYPYFSDSAVRVVFPVGTVGTPKIASTAANNSSAATQILIGNIPLASPSITIPTQAPAGTGGGTGGGGSRCISWDTLVETPTGPVKIQSCKVDDIILAPQGWTTIKFLKCSVEPVFCIKTDNGYTLECTETHPICLEDGTWRVPEGLKTGDRIVTFENSPGVVKSVELLPGVTSVYHPGCEPYHEFWSNGILTHNLIYDK
jgi:hypothetical protein